MTLSSEQIKDILAIHDNTLMKFFTNRIERLDKMAQKCPTSSPAHLFAIRGKRKRGPGTLQTRDQNLPK